jgi:hypothetical protein
MKKTIVALSILAMTGSAFAQVNNVSDAFLGKSFELLIKTAPKMRITGDVHKNEKLKPILDELSQHISDRLFSANLDNTKNRIRDFTSVCEMYPRGIAAKCSVIIQYNPIGETAVSYFVGLDKEKMPVSIMENRAEITRGD